MSWTQTFPTPYFLTQSFSWIVSVKVLTHTAEGRVPIQALGTAGILQVPKPQAFR